MSEQENKFFEIKLEISKIKDHVKETTIILLGKL